MWLCVVRRNFSSNDMLEPMMRLENVWVLIRVGIPLLYYNVLHYFIKCTRRESSRTARINFCCELCTFHELTLLSSKTWCQRKIFKKRNLANFTHYFVVKNETRWDARLCIFVDGIFLLLRCAASSHENIWFYTDVTPIIVNGEYAEPIMVKWFCLLLPM